MRPIFNTFLKGLIFTLPLALTFGLLYWIFFQAENILKIPLSWILPEGTYITGMGVFSALVLIFFVGILVQTYVIKHILRFFQALVAHTPFVKTLYSAIRDFINLFSSDKDKSMRSVVAVTLDNDIRLLGFVTNDSVVLGSASDLVAVYLPMSYQIGGYTLLVPKGRLEPLDMPVKEAMQKTLTAHVVKQDYEKSK